jgi:DNA invertase Pin-like site-specific DNA recombinase
VKAKRVAIYVRVSTEGQDTALQEAELRDSAERRGWEIKLYRDHGQSGAKESRPGLDALRADVRRRKIDAVMVWSLCRLARSLKQLLALAEEFQTHGVDLLSHKQAIDTTSPAGRLTYSVLGAVAEFEREMLRERVRAGLAQAKRAGKRVGRPPLRHFDAEEKEEIRCLRKKGASIRGLAIQFRTTQYIVAKLVEQAHTALSENHSIF